MSTPKAHPGFSTINPFIITRDAEGIFRFLADVFGGVEHTDARTNDPDGLVLHSALEIGGSTVVVADRKPGWPFIPSLLQVWVEEEGTWEPTPELDYIHATLLEDMPRMREES